MTSKLKLVVPIVLAVAGGAYQFVLKEPPAEPKVKVHGEVYVMPKEFLVNLADGRLARLNVGMVFDHGFTSAPAAAGGHGAAPKPPEGYGQLRQEPIVRDIVTDVLTEAEGRELTGSEGREVLKRRIVKRIKKSTDVKVHEVLFTDVAVQ
jgi:flagellar FliL protein